MLSRLTGNATYEAKARRAVETIYGMRRWAGAREGAGWEVGGRAGSTDLRLPQPAPRRSCGCSAAAGCVPPQLAELALCCVPCPPRSARGLVGNTLGCDSGRWERTDAGVGAGVDSFYEYLLKVGGMTASRP